jgi:DNA-binding MarR family transcriptional regulator
MLDRLEEAQLIRRKPNPKDRRGVLVETSEQYIKMVRPFVAGLQQTHRELLVSYSDRELKVIADFLTRFSGNVLERVQAIEKS